MFFSYFISFCATRSSSLPNESNPIPFENVIINDGDAFNLQKHRFVTPFTGFYWIHFSVSLPTATWANVRLLGYNTSLDIVRQHTNFTGKSITASRDGILFLQKASELWLSSDYAIYSDQYQQTSFSGFPLTLMFNPLVLFSVARSKSLLFQNNRRISYNIINSDTANAWDSVNNEYIAPFKGTYIISVSSGAYPKSGHVVDINVNDLPLAGNIILEVDKDAQSGIDIISRIIITTLEVGDRLYTTFDPYLPLYSSMHHQLTTLLGFLYSPNHFIPVSWCVGRKEGGWVYGEAYPFVFDCMLINQGNGWNENTNRYLVPLTGVYYIHLTLCSPGFFSKLELMRNGFPVMNVQVEASTAANFLTSRAIILRLEKGEQLCVRLPSGFSALARANYYISFSGFRIYA